MPAWTAWYATKGDSSFLTRYTRSGAEHGHDERREVREHAPETLVGRRLAAPLELVRHRLLRRGDLDRRLVDERSLLPYLLSKKVASLIR
jgi:hypothetical protein